MDEEAREIRALNHPTSSSKKTNIALKAKQVVEESSDDQEEEEDNPMIELQQSMEEMALFVKRFGKIFKKSGFGKGKEFKNFGKFKSRPTTKVCYECGQAGHFIAKCPNKKDDKEKSHKKKDFRRKGKFPKKNYKAHAHIGEEWNSDDSSSSDSDDNEDGVAGLAMEVITPSTLFGDSSDDEAPICLMAKGNKVQPLKKSGLALLNDDSDSGESDNEVLNDEMHSMSSNVIAKIKFLLSTIESHEKLIREHEDTLDAQEDLLIAEKQKNAKLEKRHAKDKAKIDELQELANKYMLSHNEIETSHDTLQDAFSHLDNGYKKIKGLYVNLVEEHENLKIANSSIAPLEDKTMPCSKCANDSNNHDSILSENLKLKSQLQFGLLKCHKGSKALKELLSNQVENFNREGLGFIPKLNDNGKTWLPHQYPKTKFIHAKGKKSEDHFDGHETKKRQLSKTIGGGNFDVSYVLRKGKDGKVFAKYVGPRNSGLKKCSIWVPKLLVTNLQGPTQKWVPKAKV
jgi:hypothetical protein